MEQEVVTLTSLGDKIKGRLFLPAKSDPAPVLIVAHGALMFKENCFELCAYLAEVGIAALALDMHGHGESSGGRYHVEMALWVADIQEALNFLARHPKVDGQRMGAWGHSSGGTAILEAALIDPRLKTLITLDGTVRNSLGLVETVTLQGLSWVGQVKRMLTGQDLHFSVVKLFEGVHTAVDPEVDRQLREDPRCLSAFSSFPLPGAKACFFVDTLKRVGGILVPTLVIWGEEDELDPPESGRMLYDALTCEKQLHIIPGNGHMGHCDQNKAQVFALTADWALRHL